MKLIDAAKANGIARYVIVSRWAPTTRRPAMNVRRHLLAKAAADEALADPASTTRSCARAASRTTPGTGRIDAAEHLGRRGRIPRDDVAATLVAVLDEPATIGKDVEILSGEKEIAEALRDLEARASSAQQGPDQVESAGST